VLYLVKFDIFVTGHM